MKAFVEHYSRRIYKVKVVQGNQTFYLYYEGSKRECEWYASMFNKALKFHDDAKKSKKITTVA